MRVVATGLCLTPAAAGPAAEPLEPQEHQLVQRCGAVGVDDYVPVQDGDSCVADEPRELCAGGLGGQVDAGDPYRSRGGAGELAHGVRRFSSAAAERTRLLSRPATARQAKATSRLATAVTTNV